MRLLDISCRVLGRIREFYITFYLKRIEVGRDDREKVLRVDLEDFERRWYLSRF